RYDHDDSLIKDMSSMMRNILSSNSKVASQKLLEGATCASYELAKSVIKTCAEVDDELNYLVCEFISSCIYDRDAVDCWLKEYYHEIIFEIFQCAPHNHMLLPIIDSLIGELSANQVDVRLKAVKLVGKVFAILEQHVAQKFRDLFVQFLERFYDKSAYVRIEALQCAKAVYAVNPFWSESHEFITSVEDRLFDSDAEVRMHAVVVACDIFSSNLKLVPKKLMALMAEAIKRLQDTEISVRKLALQKLMEVYQDYCKKCCEGSMAISDHFEEIPCKILILCRHMECEELRPKRMELILADHLFPDHLSVMERTKHWIHMFSLFRTDHIKALITVWYHKRRLQEDMKNYLAMRKRSKVKCKDFDGFLITKGRPCGPFLFIDYGYNIPSLDM
ncbi:sister chromatid cohesion PDS5-like protein, partial [Trifolium pratense]